LWVKGSGGDIGSMKLDGFATLYLDRLLALEARYRGVSYEDEMVALLPHCTFDLNQRAASIDTPLHGFLPFQHVDHVHPDAIIALAASAGGERATQEIWGGAIGWLPWQRPGFDLGLKLRDFAAARPDARGVMLAGHGIICWAPTSAECYRQTITLIADAARYLNNAMADRPAFGGQCVAPRAREQRRARAAMLMPQLRGMMRGGGGRIADFSDDAETLEFVGSNDFARLAALGTSCPDHFLRTKIAPLVLDPDRLDDLLYLDTELARYRDEYAAYYARCARSGDPAMRDCNPVVVLVPGLGRMTFAADKTTARLAGEFYANAINVMRGAEAIGGYTGLDEQEAFGIEYWSLEEAKLRRLPRPKALAGRVAIITGAAGGIGLATARRLAAEGACVMISDRDEAALNDAETALSATYGRDVIRSCVCDVTDELAVEQSFAACAIEFGGVDVFVANAGIASSAAIGDTDLALWQRNHDVLAQGYFLTSRAAFAAMMASKGGSIVFIGSKNGVAATINASAYASAKAASLHLARCLAVEGGTHGIRVNVVNPDAVIRGSRIWNGAWRNERADAHGIDSGDALETHYRERSLLKRDVLPDDVAEAVFFFASDASAKCTGNMLNVDAGNAQAFPR
jgi:rhamnulose-1-phosphate aldolase/alcohol dehydrogenase